jgi:Skp family chaperone for outer membrane proteins
MIRPQATQTPSISARLPLTPDIPFEKLAMMKKLILASFLALSLGGLPASADLKVAIVDTGKAFDAFYKTKDTATRIAAKQATFAKQIQELEEEYEDARVDAQNLETTVKNTAAPQAIRQSSDTALAEKVKDLQSMESEIDEMQKSRSQEIKDDLLRSHKEISDEIMRVITAFVSSQGYDLVLDKSVATTGTSFFPYNSTNVTDLTNDIITRLNAGAPPSK